uniref:Uncharacterized protein n=1 Tax=Micrurus spixii TaxID=129469 RepID=A0A2D4N9T2_9SAUR
MSQFHRGVQQQKMEAAQQMRHERPGVCCMQSSGGSGWTDSRTGHRWHGVKMAAHLAFPSGLAHKQPHFGKRQRGLPFPLNDIRRPYSLPSKTKKGELRVPREGGPGILRGALPLV